jgi:LEA14-like dessication related protein
MKQIRPFLIFGGIGVIGFALYRYYMRQINFLKDITYQVTGIKIRSITTSQVSLDITTRIYNASNVEATVKEMYLDLYINDARVGNITEVKDILILPTKTTDITFNFAFNPRLVGKNLIDIITRSVNAKDVIFDIKGYIRVKSSFVTASIPFEYQNNFKSLIKR